MQSERVGEVATDESFGRGCGGEAETAASARVWITGGAIRSSRAAEASRSDPDEAGPSGSCELYAAGRKHERYGRKSMPLAIRSGYALTDIQCGNGVGLISLTGTPLPVPAVEGWVRGESETSTPYCGVADCESVTGTPLPALAVEGRALEGSETGTPYCGLGGA